MIIKEVFVKNFGKFQNERFRFHPGINIVYGGNESGKTTLYTFLQGIFFGIRRKRGLASRTDTYITYQPWENPGWYEGSVLFESGGKDFRLERNFESRSQSADLYCVTDGEKMSVEEGDLEMLLGGISQDVYENTLSIGQLKSRTEEGLAAELREYLANFQTEGDFRLNPEGAERLLKEKRREWEKAEKKALEQKEELCRKLLYGIEYTREEIRELEEKLENLREQREEEPEKKKVHEAQKRKEGGPFPTALVLLLFLVFLAGCGGVWFFHISWLLLPLILVSGGAFFFWYLRKRPEEGPSRNREGERSQAGEERKKGRKLTYQESLQDKKNRLYNLQEELEEAENDNEQILKARKEAQSIALAEKVLSQAAGELQRKRGDSLKDRLWEILRELTKGKYQGGILDGEFQIRLDAGDRYVGLHQVSHGTAEQVYFALRMAAGELLSREEELPVLLDETFAMYDDKRLCQALEWLQKSKGQTILFTCTKREIEALERLGIPWHLIRI